MSNKIFKYNAISYKRKSWNFELVTFFCPASELSAWCGVYRKEITQKGYQRTLKTPHQEGIKDFLDQEENCIPNSVVIAFNDKLKVGQKHKNAAKFTEVTPANIENASVYAGPPDDEVLSSNGFIEIEVHSRVLEVFTKGIDPNDESLAPFKSAYVIDGQHRMLGAALNSNPNYFAVSAFVGINHEEQAFHFIVINYKARKVTKHDIDSVVPKAIYKDLQKRLNAAGIITSDADFVYALDNDADSAFQGMVKWANNQTGIYTKGGIDKIVKLIQKIEPDILAEFSSPLKLFKIIWDEIKNHFDDIWDSKTFQETENSTYDNQWLIKSAGVLPSMQLWCNEILTGEYTTQKDPEKVVRKLIKDKVTRIPLEFFYCKWNTKSITNDDRQKDLVKLFQKAARTSKVPYESEWFEKPQSKEQIAAAKEAEKKIIRDQAKAKKAAAKAKKASTKAKKAK